MLKTRPARSGPPPLSRALGKVVATLAKKSNALDPRLAANWAEIAGPDLARFTRPVRLKPNGRSRSLELAVPNGAAAMQVQFKQQFILDKVNIVLGRNAVTKIIIRQTGGAVPADTMPSPYSVPAPSASTSLPAPMNPPIPIASAPSGKQALAAALERLQNLIEHK